MPKGFLRLGHSRPLHTSLRRIFGRNEFKSSGTAAELVDKASGIRMPIQVVGLGHVLDLRELGAQLRASALREMPILQRRNRQPPRCSKSG
jgi:hypothetical protein